MKSKTLPILIIIIFISIFFIFFKGLKNLNIYTPKSNSEIDIPSFKAKVFDTDNAFDNKFVVVVIGGDDDDGAGAGAGVGAGVEIFVVFIMVYV